MARHLNKPSKNKVKIQKPPKVLGCTREFFFHTPIYFKDIENSKQLNKTLLSNIKKWKKEDEQGIIRSNALGWHSGVDMHHRKEYQPLIKELFKMQTEIYKAESYHPNTEPVCDNMWANVNYKYSHNKNHVHPGAQWSGVYYIKVPKDGGNIWFTDPCGERHIDLPIMADKQVKPVHYWREIHYQAIEGRILMFPGWLTHEVQQNMSDLKGENGWRVSVSFNFKQMWKQGQYVAPQGGHNHRGNIRASSIK